MNEQSISFGNPYLSTGSSSVTHIANVPDNDMADITRLLELWRNKYPRNLLRSAFYDAKQRFNNLGISIPNIVAQKAGVVVGWPQKSVRALADKSVFEGFETAAGADNHGIDEIMRMNELETDMSEAVISCYKHSCSFLTIDYDPDDNERILITPRSADWSAALWDNERRRIKAALTITDSDKWGNITAFNAWLPGRNYACMKTGYGWTAEPQYNRLDRVAVVPIVYDKQMDRPLRPLPHQPRPHEPDRHGHAHHGPHGSVRRILLGAQNMVPRPEPRILPTGHVERARQQHQRDQPRHQRRHTRTQTGLPGIDATPR
jgi:hypothetical protein